MPKDYEVDEALVERLSHTIVASLKDTKWKLKEIKRLPAGEINWTFRGWLATPQDGSQKTVIIKHAEEDVALHPGWALSLDRSVRLEHGPVNCEADDDPAGDRDDAHQNALRQRASEK